MIKKLLLFLLPAVLLFLALYFLAGIDFWGAVFVGVFTSALSYHFPFNKKKETSDNC